MNKLHHFVNTYEFWCITIGFRIPSPRCTSMVKTLKTKLLIFSIGPLRYNFLAKWIIYRIWHLYKGILISSLINSTAFFKSVCHFQPTYIQLRTWDEYNSQQYLNRHRLVQIFDSRLRFDIGMYMPACTGKKRKIRKNSSPKSLTTNMVQLMN